MIVYILLRYFWAHYQPSICHTWKFSFSWCRSMCVWESEWGKERETEKAKERMSVSKCLFMSRWRRCNRFNLFDKPPTKSDKTVNYCPPPPPWFIWSPCMCDKMENSFNLCLSIHIALKCYHKWLNGAKRLINRKIVIPFFHHIQKRKRDHSNATLFFEFSFAFSDQIDSFSK